jgi:hypothetical protein
VDLSAAGFVNASALAVLFRAGAEARARAAGFDVHGLPRPVERFLAGRQLTLTVIAA